VEDLVRQGRVRINGMPVDDLAARVDILRDRVEVDGRPVAWRPGGRILAYHKPAGVISSFRRQGDLPCLADVLPADLRRGRLFHVGRLDRDSTGLLLLSDDGDLAHTLLHPSHPVFKHYRVELDHPLRGEDLARIEAGGLLLDDGPCAPAPIAAIGGTVYRIRLREGRKRQIRRMMEVLGRRVLRLHREAFGPIELGGLPPGAWRELTADEVAALRRAAD
jgi:23S rRNA pseudouridine2605 synthase